MTNDTIDKHQLKITVAVAIGIIIFLITTTANFATWKTDIEASRDAMITRQDHLSAGHSSIRTVLSELEHRQDSTEISNAEIKTRLVSIESLLVDIRQDLRSR